ncbi:hypothetical protein GALMADRAFT_472981 [Galerina marginata CBS 339.88]|uniref:Uncharacterized protein n=1 Tax=Galerina marginata (strain CBS 339.88) TaxID=685588 RepID=A0A067SZA6_GALM3|nr:hypothetical protein GALMADRAFT_472981 [Galerina marginata CBS 339.88]
MSDYVVRPKRRRNGFPFSSVQPVDPCLGYYVSTAKPASDERLYAPQSKDIRTSHDLEERMVLSSFDGELELEIPLGFKDLDDDANVDIENESRPASRATESSTQSCVADWTAFVPEPRRFWTPALVVAPSHVNEAVEETKENDSAGHRTPTNRQNVVTVEEFLKRSSDQKPAVKRRYGKKRLYKKAVENVPDQAHCDIDETEDSIRLRSRQVRREPLLADPSSEIGTSSVSHGPSSPMPSPRLSPSKKSKKKNHNKQKPLKQRIYEAAISTYGEPDAEFMRPAKAGEDPADQNRAPLRFVPGPNIKERHLGRTRTRRHNWTLVDPRKFMAIRTASFSSRLRPLGLAPNNCEDGRTEPSADKRWKWDEDLGVPSLPDIVVERDSEGDSRQQSNKCMNTGKRKRAHEGCPPTKVFECPPLMFVSLHEAENSYAAMFPSRQSSTRKQTHVASLKLEPLRDSPPKDNATRSEIHRLTQSKHGTKPLTPSLEMVMIAEVPRSTTPDVSALIQPAQIPHQVPLDTYSLVDGSPNVEPPCPAAQALEPRSCSPLNLGISSPVQAPTLFPIIPRPREVSPVRVAGLNCSTAEGSLRAASLIDKNDQTNRPQKAAKSLKPLGSFMDEILETIRSVKGAEISESKTRPTNRYKSASSNSVIGSSLERSFDPKKSHFKSAHEVENSTTLPCPHFQDVFFDYQEFRPECLNQIQRFPSPDILAALQPSNYQVILSSSP